MAIFDPKFYEHEQQESQPIVQYAQPRKTHGRYIVFAVCTVLLATLMVVL
jgi:hypothetical protein